MSCSRSTMIFAHVSARSTVAKFLALDSCYDFVRFAGKAKIDEGAVNAFIKTVLQQLCAPKRTLRCSLSGTPRNLDKSAETQAAGRSRGTTRRVRA